MERAQLVINAIRFNLLLETLRFLSNIYDINSTMDNIIHQIHWVIDFDRCCLARNNGNGKLDIDVFDLRDSTSCDISDHEYELVDRVIISGIMERQVQIESGKIYVCFPMIIGNRTIGAILFGSADENAFNNTDVQFSRAIAYFLGMLLERLKQFEIIQRNKDDLENLNKSLEQKINKRTKQLRELSIKMRNSREDERKVIARDLHDQLGQSFTGLKLNLARLSKKYLQSSKSLSKEIDSIIEIIDSNITYIQELSSYLRPSILDDFGLAAAIQWQLEESTTKSGHKFKFNKHNMNLKIGTAIELAMFRIFQEALTNILRHAEAKYIDVDLRRLHSQFQLIIKDNGRGITEQEKVNLKSLGLLSMCERANEFGGNVLIERIEEGGTIVTVDMPFHSDGDRYGDEKTVT